MKNYNALYAQSGGPTAVINSTACGVIQAVRHYPNRIGTLFIAQYGLLGLLEESLLDTKGLSQQALQQLRYTPSAAFGSCRYKLNITEDRTLFILKRIFKVFEAYKIRYFLYNGGGDSQDTIAKIETYSRKINYPLTCIGIPKTIDNDIPGTDHCPGFGSAAKYVSTSVLEMGLDLKAIYRNSTKVFILEVMGRNSGWLAAASGLSAQTLSDAPQLILFPEVPFDATYFLNQVSTVVKKVGYCFIVAAEGLRAADGKIVSAMPYQDAFHHIQLGGVAAKLAQYIQSHLGCKVRSTALDYLQRCAGHIASNTDNEQAYQLGQEAVHAAMKGSHACMLTILRQSNQPYRWTIGEVPLMQVANQERILPREFIREDGLHITDQYRAYLRPLIQGEAYPRYLKGLPDYWNTPPLTTLKKLPLFDISASVH